MKALSSLAINFFRSQEGATTVEYGLLVGLLSIVAVAALAGVRDFLAEAFGRTVVEFARGGISGK